MRKKIHSGSIEPSADSNNTSHFTARSSPKVKVNVRCKEDGGNMNIRTIAFSAMIALMLVGPSSHCLSQTNMPTALPRLEKGREQILKLTDLSEKQPKDAREAMLIALKCVDFSVRLARLEAETKTSYRIFLEDGYHFQAMITIDIDKMTISTRRWATD